ncbi:glycosyltransferase [Haloarcula salina]|uniref:Glycosyltransferase n=1 Tax=Haloarcula salina TaxID=1429914 RepID=A0AA41FX35_9EURY|nr:glycosyltransferase [Haloarcula salina]MBV0900407.1 glycosyltransferase [Haloarcula salina]
MDILYVLERFPQISESFIVNELYELSRRGHNVYVFSFDESNEDIEHDELSKVQIPIEYGSTPSLSSYSELSLGKLSIHKFWKELIFIDHPVRHLNRLCYSKQILDYIRDCGGVDVIHAHFATTSKLSAVYASRSYGIPCTVTAHATEIFADPNFRLLRQVLQSYDGILTPSKYNKSYLKDNCGEDLDIRVVPATTRVDKFKPSNEHVPGRVLTVARLVEKKGHKYAIEGISELLDRGYNLKYHIVGTGRLESDLRQQVNENCIEDHVEFLGHVTDSQLQQEFNEAELFILPCVIASNGDRDVAPVSLKEAMATQTACISTTVSAIPELITDEYDGLLVEPRHSDKLADSIAHLIDNPTYREEIAKNGRDTVRKQFDISTSVDAMVEYFKEIDDR